MKIHYIPFMKIVLLGYMGSGKSTVGKALAEKLNFPFKDLDSEIEILEGKTISQLFSEKGEIYFRKIENQLLKKILQNENNLVVATGGGTPCYGDTLEFLLASPKVTSIYLQTEIPELSKRLFPERKSRPLISHLKSEEEVFDFVRKHLFERSFYYNQADLIIKTGQNSTNEITGKILEKLF